VGSAEVRYRHGAEAVLTGYVTGSTSEADNSVPWEALESAIRASWSLETCDPTDIEVWSASHPSRGQCAVTALVVHDLFGGELLEAEVHYQDGTRQGFHYWNRLDGREVDLTREQFTEAEILQEPHVIDRLPEFPWRAEEQYQIFRTRVQAALKAGASESS